MGAGSRYCCPSHVQASDDIMTMLKSSGLGDLNPKKRVQARGLTTRQRCRLPPRPRKDLHRPRRPRLSLLTVTKEKRMINQAKLNSQAALLVRCIPQLFNFWLSTLFYSVLHHSNQLIFFNPAMSLFTRYSQTFFITMSNTV